VDFYILLFFSFSLPGGQILKKSFQQALVDDYVAMSTGAKKIHPNGVGQREQFFLNVHLSSGCVGRL